MHNIDSDLIIFFLNLHLTQTNNILDRLQFDSFPT